MAPSKAKNDSFAQGANFAITGATALDAEFFHERGLGKTVWSSGSLFTQILWLSDLKPSFCNSTQGIIYGDYFTPVVQFMLQPEKFDQCSPLMAIANPQGLLMGPWMTEFVLQIYTV